MKLPEVSATFPAAARRAALLLSAAATLAGCDAGADPATDPRLALGRQLFLEQASPTCATCHTLRDAESTGKVGPDLDLMRPDSQRVAAAVTNGVGIMPAQGGTLTAEQIGAVAHYVAHVAGNATEE